MHWSNVWHAVWVQFIDLEGNGQGAGCAMGLAPAFLFVEGMGKRVL